MGMQKITMMKNALRFLIVWFASLSVLMVVAWFTVMQTTRSWFEHDLALSAELAVSGARQALTDNLVHSNVDNLNSLLGDIARGERIVAAALCTDTRKQIAVTANFPLALACNQLGKHLNFSNTTEKSDSWRETITLRDSDVQVSAISLLSGHQTVGFVVLVQDLSFAARRANSAQLFLLIAFVVLAVLASIVTFVSAKIMWRGWSNTLRDMALGGEIRHPEFVPLLKDLRDLLDRLAIEERTEVYGGQWTPQRLKLTLQRHLHGERIVVVANREPYIHDRAEDGSIRVLHPASGLVSALEPVMRACSGVWIAHGAGSADRDTVDEHDCVRVPPGEESYVVRRLWLSEAEEKGYYYGFANEGLWPLCHVAHVRPTFRAEDWQYYQAVNQKFADAICEEVDTDNPVIVVQDYHFALVPRMVRERLPHATIITFWHIPWPNAEQISICPWHSELIEGLLGSSILGFHTQFHCNNFLEAVDRFLEARVDREDLAVVQHQRRTLVRAYPISTEWPHRWADQAPPGTQCRAEVFAELGLPGDALLGIGIDRLDYTKGIEERFLAIERLLEREPVWCGRFTFLQIASPSRTLIERYRQLDRDVEQLAERINARFATAQWQPIVLRRQHTEPLDVFRLYRAADLCYVSSLHDGMNLVAKEYLVAHDDERGVLILSQFTGAARELPEALIVNPYDIDAAAAALSTALRMPAEEQRVRIRAMRRLIAEFNVYRWAGRMLLDASRLRKREQLSGLLSERAQSQSVKP
jgi:trehalose 6-phosphate synthase